MSIATALARVNQLNARVEALQTSTSKAQSPAFNVALDHAYSRFDQGATRLDNPIPGTSANDRANITQGKDINARVAAPRANATAGAAAPPALEPVFARIAAKHGVPVALVKAVARAESGFRTDAVSGAGAQGLMQLMPATGRGLGVTNPFDAEQSIEGGTRYLRNALRNFDGDVELAVASYNAGTGAVRRHGGIPPYPETQRYVQRVMQYAREYGLQVSVNGLIEGGPA